MTGPFADRLFRITFALAGVYNLAFGLWAAIWPLAFFRLFEIPLPRYPGSWACVGMVVGVYGLLYWHAAWKLETAWPIIAVGLLGKVLGPIGMVTSFSDDWPRRLGMLCVYNDLIWWLPFGLFLVRGTAIGRWLVGGAPWLCAASHALALAWLGIALQSGTLAEADPATRFGFIMNHQLAWSLGWLVWMLAAATLIGFYAWWGSRLDTARDSLPSATTPVIATFAVLTAAFGMVCDFTGEGSLILLLIDRLQIAYADAVGAVDFTQAKSIERAVTLCCAGAANGLYTLGGVMLTLVTPNLPKWIRGAMWTTWLAGAGMTLFAILDFTPGLELTTAVLFPLLVGWVTWMGLRWNGT